MKKNSGFSFRKLFASNRFSVIFAVIVAFIIWLVISIDQTEVIPKTFANIPLNFTTEGSFAGDMGLQVISIEQDTNATVTAKGPNSVVSSLDISDILITPDLSNVTGAGTYTITLGVKPLSKDSGVTFDISPKTVNVVFDYVDTVEFDVIPVSKNITLAKDVNNNLFVGEPVINSNDYKKITINGPRANMKLLHKVEAVIDATESIGQSKTYDAEIVLYDKNGNTLDKSLFVLPGEEIKVTVPVYTEKTVSLNCTFINETPNGAGAQLQKKLSVSNVAVYGLPEVVDEIKSVDLSAIDFKTINASNKVFKVTINLPDGVYLKDNITEVTVTFTLD